MDAVNVRTGGLVWRRSFEVGTTGLGGTFVGSPAIDGDRLILLVNRENAPFAIALDRHTGATMWMSEPYISGPLYYTNATPLVANGIVVAGYSPPEGEPDGQGGVALLDAANGDVLADVKSIPPAQRASGHAGGGMWTTPAIDPTTRHAYYGVGNPYSKEIESDHTNAILKVDIHRERPTFGKVVGFYKGNIEQVTPALHAASRPTCELFGQTSLLRNLPRRFPALRQFQQFLANSPACLQLDMDFGSAPNLFEINGHTVVGNLQKSGYYHTVDAQTMRKVWTRLLGLSCEFCNAASTAHDGTSILAPVSPGALLAAAEAATGARRWYSPIGGGFTYAAVSVAGGVAFHTSQAGVLHAYDASTGAPLFARPLALVGAPDAAGFSSSGIAIARGYVLVAAGSHLLAYGLPA